MENIKNYVKLSQQIYDVNRIKEYRRMAVFVIRAILNNPQMRDTYSFFQSTKLLSEIALANPCLLEQVTRNFFYHKSTLSERALLIREHFSTASTLLNQLALRQIYITDGLNLWRHSSKAGELSLSINFEAGDKKEGLMTLVFSNNNTPIYRILFWLAPNGNQQPAVWIGALQGLPNGLDILRYLTKHFFGYRPKNFAIYALRIVASQLAIANIYAVSNYGFYANNHLRLDRKLKTSLDDFWEETGGKCCPDKRFFELPLVEPRKSLAEVVSHKRNLYRKRFALMDEVSASITASLKSFLN